MVLASCHYDQQMNNKLAIANYSQFEQVKAKIKNQSPAFVSAYTLLLKEAQDLLLNSSYRARKEAGAHTELSSVMRFVNDIWVLDMAWVYSGDEKYAHKASAFLEEVFINPQTKLDPKLVYQNYVEEKRMNMELSYDPECLDLLMDAVNVLEVSKEWGRLDTKKVDAWVDEFAGLMQDFESDYQYCDLEGKVEMQDDHYLNQQVLETLASEVVLNSTTANTSLDTTAMYTSLLANHRVVLFPH